MNNNDINSQCDADTQIPPPPPLHLVPHFVLLPPFTGRNAASKSRAQPRKMGNVNKRWMRSQSFMTINGIVNDAWGFPASIRCRMDSFTVLSGQSATRTRKQSLDWLAKRFVWLNTGLFTDQITDELIRKWTGSSNVIQPEEGEHHHQQQQQN